MSERPVQNADRLSQFEALMWTLERDPQLTSGFANITFLDRPCDPVRMRARMQRAAALIPQLRRRIFTDPARVAPPRWVDDPDFSIERHVRTAHLDPSDGLESLIDAAVQFCDAPYDANHPLWEFVLVDGIGNGAGAMLQRFHHTIADGVGMMRMSEHFIDLTRDPPERDPIPIPVGAPLPTAIGASREALGHTLGRTLSSLKNGIVSTGDALRSPARLVGSAQASLELGRALTRELKAMGNAKSSLWTERSSERTLRLLRVPFDEIRALAGRFDVTINDVFVAGAAGGAGAYHRFAGSPAHELRMAMPVNTRTDRSSGGNAFGMARLVVPTGEDPVTRLHEVHTALSTARTSAGVSLMQDLATVANLLPAKMVVAVARSQVSSVDFTTSNVRGAPFEVYMGGALVESNHPIGPLAGTAFNLTVLSYNGSLDMGLHIDTRAIEAPDLLAQCIRHAFDELLAL